MVLVTPFFTAFWIIYLCGGFSDIMDGMIARKSNQQSDTGAKLDSIADLIFAIAILIVVITTIILPLWLWWWIILVAIVRIASYGIGFYKFHTFSSLHTYMNKVSGILIFVFPLMYVILGINIAAIIIIILTLLSSVEELIIRIKSHQLDYDCKCLFMLYF